MSSPAARCGGDHAGRKGTNLRKAAPEKALGYQVAVSIPILGIASWLFGEKITHMRARSRSRCWPISDLGGRLHLRDLVALVKVYFAQQIVGLHLQSRRCSAW